LAGDLEAQLGEELVIGALEVFQSKVVGKFEAELSGRDKGCGSEDEQSGAALLGKIAQAEPGAGGDALNFPLEGEMEIDEDEEEIGGARDLFGFAAADPEQGRGGRLWIETVCTVDEDEVTMGSGAYVNQRADEQTDTTAGMPSGDFGDCGFGNADVVKEIETGGERGSVGELVVCGRKTFA